MSVKAATPIALATGQGHTLWGSSNPTVPDSTISSVQDFLSQTPALFNHGDRLNLVTRESYYDIVVAVPAQMNPSTIGPVKFIILGRTRIAP